MTAWELFVSHWDRARNGSYNTEKCALTWSVFECEFEITLMHDPKDPWVTELIDLRHRLSLSGYTHDQLQPALLAQRSRLWFRFYPSEVVK